MLVQGRKGGDRVRLVPASRGGPRLREHADEGELLGRELVAMTVQRSELEVVVGARRAAIVPAAIGAEVVNQIPPIWGSAYGQVVQSAR